MAGHSKFKNIQHRKGAQDQKRAKIFTKLVREIITAVKAGGNDPNINPRLRSAIVAARSHNLPKERIEKAVLQAASENEGENYVEIRYEGFAPGGIALIVEALTDNKNRAAAEVRSAFTRLGGNLGESGSVSFMFEHVGIIYYLLEDIEAESVFESAIECSAREVESNDEYHAIYVDIDNFINCQEFFVNKYGMPNDSYIGWRPKNSIEIEEKETAEKLLKLIECLEESDEVQRVFGNYRFSPALLIG